MAEAMEAQSQQMWVGGVRVVTHRQRAQRQSSEDLGSRLTAATGGEGAGEQGGGEWEELMAAEEEMMMEELEEGWW